MIKGQSPLGLKCRNWLHM